MENYSALLLTLLLMLAVPVSNISAEAVATSEFSVVSVTNDNQDSKATASKDNSIDSAKDKLEQIKNLVSFGSVLLIIIILVLTYFIVHLLVHVIDNLAERVSKYRLAIKRLVPVSRILVWGISAYVIIVGVISPPLEIVVAVSATIGVAVGLASQGIIKNVFGGFMIILDRAFQVGDKIEVNNYYGEVLQIGLRSTKIVTPADSVVSVPNGEVISNAVSNTNSGALDCQVVADIYLPASTNIKDVKKIARKAVISSKYVYLKKPIAIIAKSEVHEENFVIKLLVKAYVLDIRFEFPFQSEITEQIITECNREGLIPAPKTSV